VQYRNLSAIDVVYVGMRISEQGGIERDRELPAVAAGARASSDQPWTFTTEGEKELIVSFAYTDGVGNSYVVPSQLFEVSVLGEAPRQGGDGAPGAESAGAAGDLPGFLADGGVWVILRQALALLLAALAARFALAWYKTNGKGA